ncbi:MAG: MopE-related protein [Polyangiaceae bacterium]
MWRAWTLSALFTSLAMGSSGCADDAFCFGDCGQGTSGAAGSSVGGTSGTAGNSGTAGSVTGGSAGIAGTANCNADTTSDPDNCGACGNRCDLLNAFAKCEASECKIDSCVPGFADLDTGVAGCEYQCPVFPTTAELCDGLDNDCDGLVDADDSDLETPPSLNCKTTAGTLCEGVTATCKGELGWACNYPDGVEVDQGVIRAEETKCDGIDGDCDGVVDDWFVNNYGLGSGCTAAAANGCIDHGLVVCNTQATAPEDPKVICDLSLVPDSLTPQPETCNGIDDDCNGQIDDAIDPSTYAMVEITGHAGVFVDKYEASRPDASSTSAGLLENIACSNPSVLPWASGSYNEAKTA